MPTPVDIFLRQDREGDAEVQLGAAQEWDWRDGRFYGFQDRSVYLRRVRSELLMSGGGRTDRWDEIDRDEDRRRHKLLLSLQAVLQSRRLKMRMLHEQMSGVLPTDSQGQPLGTLVEPIRRTSSSSRLALSAGVGLDDLQREAYDNSRRLNRSWTDPYGRAAYSVKAMKETFKEDLGLEEDTAAAVIGVSDDPSHHIYPATALQKVLYAARPHSADATFYTTAGTPGTGRRATPATPTKTASFPPTGQPPPSSRQTSQSKPTPQWSRTTPQAKAFRFPFQEDRRGFENNGQFAGQTGPDAAKFRSARADRNGYTGRDSQFRDGQFRDRGGVDGARVEADSSAPADPLNEAWLRKYLYDLADMLSSRSPTSYFPKLRPTTAEGYRWAKTNGVDGLRCFKDPLKQNQLGRIIRRLYK
ncbi:hypothetical protein GNI_126110 [Gregarina niphandrodes]|uniref:Uncharacterized protein n=1 Tax=Gregarina niphandrodes TaxID=110365 RepID=A0A023B220_GRENI|nr:hypothetical protein GNI_126110 [Gregarina niphandrodes]EZG50216.1 hypothetical protein GNI_126110 [Gregarina niphandrodes]|eukprot:XP_011132022.1 hypothetical protein GNI_126110 [Gregarina niphandrodes]